jgi:hypothetical protein
MYNITMLKFALPLATLQVAAAALPAEPSFPTANVQLL